MKIFFRKPYIYKNRSKFVENFSFGTEKVPKEAFFNLPQYFITLNIFCQETKISFLVNYTLIRKLCIFPRAYI